MVTTPPVLAAALVDVPAITNAFSAAMLARTPTSRTDLFMKNKGGVDEVKPLKEPKQLNTRQCTFLSIAHAYDSKDVTNISYVPDAVDTDACTVFELQKKYAFGILFTTIKQSEFALHSTHTLRLALLLMSPLLLQAFLHILILLSHPILCRWLL